MRCAEAGLQGGTWGAGGFNQVGYYKELLPMPLLQLLHPLFLQLLLHLQLPAPHGGLQEPEGS